MRRASLATALAAVAMTVVCPGLAAAAEPAATGATNEVHQINPSHPVQCLTDVEGNVWRVQCDEERKLCVWAPSRETEEVVDESRPPEWGRPLERVRPCDSQGDFESLRSSGYTVVRGENDTPQGWMRDERGRVFQIKFDLHKRLFAGVSWAPSIHDAAGEAADAGRMRLDFGLFEWEDTYDTIKGKAGFRHRVRLVEGDVQLAPFRADATVVHYDFSRRSNIPLVRITTFWGTPRRYDVGAHLGAWAELGHLQVDEVAPGTTESLWRLATLHATWDVWRSSYDMSSFVRVRGGAGIERAVVEEGRADRDAVTPAGAVDVDLTLDDKGFHHVTAVAQLEKPQFVGAARDVRRSATRAQAKVAYEVIVVAINDQPLTLRVAGEAEYRNDIPDVAPGWDLRAVAGVRLSLWAPALKAPPAKTRAVKAPAVKAPAR
jgi:hypothetical protein